MVGSLGKHLNAEQFLGLSTDTKPTEGLSANCLFYELDTKKCFYTVTATPPSKTERLTHIRQQL